jgi:uncharacterized protein (TIGR03382 family)
MTRVYASRSRGTLLLLTAVLLLVSARAQAGGPLTASGTTFFSTEGFFFQQLLVATFAGQDPDPNGYAVSISWGDGTIGASGTVQADGDGGFWALGSYSYLEEGRYPVSVLVTDSDGGTATAQSMAFVLNDILEVSGTSFSVAEGAPVSGAVGAFTGPSSRTIDYVVYLDWGDGTSSGGRAVVGTAPGFDVIGAHVYASEGVFAVTVTVDYYPQDSSSVVRTVGTSTATVSDALLTGIDGGAFHAFQGVAYTGVVGFFGDADGYGSWGDYAATIDWGDGDGGPSAADTIAAVDGGFAVIGTHTYAQLGRFTVGMAIVDGAGSSTFAASTAVVIAAPDSGLPQDAGLGDAGLTWLTDDGGTLIFGDGGPKPAGGCGCQSQPSPAAGSLALLGAVLALLARATRRTARR